MFAGFKGRNQQPTKTIERCQHDFDTVDQSTAGLRAELTTPSNDTGAKSILRELSSHNHHVVTITMSGLHS